MVFHLPSGGKDILTVASKINGGVLYGPKGGPISSAHSITHRCSSGFFFFIFKKKLKFQKYMSVLESFKNIPRSPYGGATGLKYNFFFQICNEVPGEKKEGPCRPPQGRQASGPARGAGRPSCGRQGGLSSPPRATGSGRLYKASPHSLLSFDLKKSKKKRGEKKGSGEALPNFTLVIYR